MFNWLTKFTIWAIETFRTFTHVWPHIISTCCIIFAGEQITFVEIWILKQKKIIQTSSFKHLNPCFNQFTLLFYHFYYSFSMYHIYFYDNPFLLYSYPPSIQNGFYQFQNLPFQIIMAPTFFTASPIPTNSTITGVWTIGVLTDTSIETLNL